jgi:hypothetical protein
VGPRASLDTWRRAKSIVPAGNRTRIPRSSRANPSCYPVSLIFPTLQNVKLGGTRWVSGVRLLAEMLAW